MDNPKKLFGNRVKKLREEIGLTQEKLALEANLDRSYLGGVERGERNISIVNIFKIAKAFNITLEKLFHGL